MGLCFILFRAPMTSRDVLGETIPSRPKDVVIITSCLKSDSKRIHGRFTCRVSMPGRYHAWPRLTEFSRSVLSCELSRYTVFTKVSPTHKSGKLSHVIVPNHYLFNDTGQETCEFSSGAKFSV